MSDIATAMSNRSLTALKAMFGATKKHPVLPRYYSGRPAFRYDGADHCVKLGLAKFRGFDGKMHGGYWLTEAGRLAVASVFKLTEAQIRVLKDLVRLGGKANPRPLNYPRSAMLERLREGGFITRGRGPLFDPWNTDISITEKGRGAIEVKSP